MNTTIESYKNSKFTKRVIIDGKTEGFINDNSSISSIHNFSVVIHSGSAKCAYPSRSIGCGSDTFDSAVECIEKAVRSGKEIVSFI